MADATTAIPSKAIAPSGDKYLAFALGNEEYGIEILKVREIIGVMDITMVPRTPGYVKGVINLRGQVISVVDLRERLQMHPVERTEATCIIVVETSGGGGGGGRKLSTGIIVDRVSEVLTISHDKIEEPPSFGGSLDTDFIRGMGKLGDRVKILLDIDKVLDRGGSEIPVELAGHEK
jgi:purine-binding chemotaxis protein CheW